MYTVTFREMEKAALALLTANTEKQCEFSTYIGHLLSQPSVQEYLLSSEYLAGKLPIDQAQCDHQAGWRNFSLNELEKTPNICSNHLTGDILPFFRIPIYSSLFVLAQALPRPTKIRHVDGQRQVVQRGDQAAQVDGEAQVRSFQRISRSWTMGHRIRFYIGAERNRQ